MPQRASLYFCKTNLNYQENAKINNLNYDHWPAGTNVPGKKRFRPK